MINAATNEIEKEEVMVGARVVVKECVKKEIWVIATGEKRVCKKEVRDGACDEKQVCREGE